MHTLCASLALLAQLAPSSAGPSPRPLKVLRPPMPMAVEVGDLVRHSMKDFAGSAVVVVEGDLPPLVPRSLAGTTVLGGRLRLFNPVKLQTFDVMSLPWMDATHAGPNGQTRMVPLGWGY